MNRKKPEFEWPEYKTEKERIRAYSNKFKNTTISEAFSDVYKIRLKPGYELVGNETPKELNIGDEVFARIIHIDKNRVEFDNALFKSTVISNNNLYKYEHLRKYIPTFDVKVRVVNKVKDRITVDVIQPMIDDFVIPRTTNPWIQKDIDKPLQPILVKDLQLTQGGFLGKAVIPNISEFIGQEYEVDAFIPGSQIVLNITSDFESFVGKSVWAFILNSTQKPGSNKTSLVCSVKEFIKTCGELNMIYMFKHWTENSEEWKGINETKFNGIITGVINNTKRFGDNVVRKCGVFVEIPDLSITGMVNVDPSMVNNYKTNDNVVVKINGFEETMRYNPAAQQMQHVEPYIIEDNKIKRCNLKPILEFVM